MILDSETIKLVTGISLTSEQETVVEKVLIPVYLDAVLQFTNQSWFNAEKIPENYTQQNPALEPTKIPDSVVAEICSMIGNDLTGDKEDSLGNVKSKRVGGISVDYFSSSELQNKFDVSKVINYYRVPAV